MGGLPDAESEAAAISDAVYQYKNFTQASEALYVSQPAISSAVQALEEELGVRLVVRSSKGVTFTYEGEQFHDLGAAHPQHL